MKTQTTRRKLTPEFKAKVVIEALREQSTLADIARKYEISQAQLSRWKKEVRLPIPACKERAMNNTG